MNLEANVGLTFNGDCEAAFKLYAQLLEAKLELVLTWGASPLADKAPHEWANKILFARLKGRTMTLTGADVLPGTYRAPAGFNLCLSTGDAAEAERLFAESYGRHGPDAAREHVLCRSATARSSIASAFRGR